MKVYKIFREKNIIKQIEKSFSNKSDCLFNYLIFDKNSLKIFNQNIQKFRENLVKMIKISQAKKDFEYVMIYNALIEVIKNFKALCFYSNIDVNLKQDVRELNFYISKFKLLDVLFSYNFLESNETFKEFRSETLILVYSIEKYFIQTFVK